MRKLLAVLSLSTAAAGLLCSPSDAATYSYRTVGRQMVVDVNGDIAINEGAILNEWLDRVARPAAIRTNTSITAVVLNSDGGNLAGGIALAQWVRSNNLNTGVSAGGTCASSCSLVWTAGVRRSVAPDARIGVHSASLANARGGASGASSTSGNKIAMQYYQAYGMPSGIIMEMLTTEPGSMYWLSPIDYVAMGVKVSF